MESGPVLDRVMRGMTMPANERPRSRKIDPQSLGELTIDEVCERFEDQWAFMRITERDEYHAPAKGVVVAIGKKRMDIQPTVMASIEEAKRTGTQYYIFKAFKRIHSGAEWVEALNRIAQPRAGGGERQ
jgi:hypothetical protein